MPPPRDLNEMARSPVGGSCSAWWCREKIAALVGESRREVASMRPVLLFRPFCSRPRGTWPAINPVVTSVVVVGRKVRPLTLPPLVEDRVAAVAAAATGPEATRTESAGTVGVVGAHEH